MFRLLSSAMSALAMVALVRHALNTGSLSAPMAAIMHAYSAIMRALLSWTEPYLQSALTALGGLAGWRPTLYSHWRDIVLLAGLSLVDELRGGRPWYRYLELPLKMAVMAAVVVAVGTTPINSGLVAIGVLVLVAVLMVLGVVAVLVSLLLKDDNAYRAGLMLATAGGGALAFFAVDAGMKLLLR